MNENQLIKIWNDQRSASVKLQIPPTIILGLVLGLGASGRLTCKSDLTLRFLTLAVVVAILLFSVRGVLATVRDGVSLSRSLEEIKGLTPLGKNIRNSSTSLIINGFLAPILALFTIVLLSFYLFKK
jgi:hypothetical protein